VGSGRFVMKYHAGNEHSCVLMDNFQMKFFGRNSAGQLGYGDGLDRGDNGNEMGNYLPQINIGTNLKALSIHLGQDHACAVLNDGSLKCWGDNAFGNLGQGNIDQLGNNPSEMSDYLPAINFGTGVELTLCFDYSPTMTPTITDSPTVTSIPSSCTSRFSMGNTVCSLTSSLQVKCWGLNSSGQQGYGDTSLRGNNPNDMGNYLPFINVDSSIISLQVGEAFSCVHLPSLDVKCFGANFDGQLGLGDAFERGNAANEMGEYLSAINFGSNIIASRIISGGYHASIVTDQGQVRVWGRNSQGQLGYGDTINRGNTVNQLGDYLPFVNLGSGLQAQILHLGLLHSCAILNNGNVKCWGYNVNGELGQENVIVSGSASNQMGDYLPPINFPTGVIIESMGNGWYTNGIISITGGLYLWGRESDGQLGLGQILNDIGDSVNEMGNYLQQTQVGSGRTVLAYSGGIKHSCVILDTFNVKCFGSNDNGVLGYGDTSKRGDESLEMGDYLPNVNLGFNLKASSLHIGQEHTCIELNNRYLKCYGLNGSGQLVY